MTTQNTAEEMQKLLEELHESGCTSFTSQDHNWDEIWCCQNCMNAKIGKVQDYIRTIETECRSLKTRTGHYKAEKNRMAKELGVVASRNALLEKEHRAMREAFQYIQLGKLKEDNESGDRWMSMTMRFMNKAKEVLSSLTIK